jgi:hypothetical protein
VPVGYTIDRQGAKDIQDSGHSLLRRDEGALGLLTCGPSIPLKPGNVYNTPSTECSTAPVSLTLSYLLEYLSREY